RSVAKDRMRRSMSSSEGAIPRDLLTSEFIVLVLFQSCQVLLLSIYPGPDPGTPCHCSKHQSPHRSEVVAGQSISRDIIPGPFVRFIRIGPPAVAYAKAAPGSSSLLATVQRSRTERSK